MGDAKLTVKKVLAPSHLAGVPTALNQKIVKVQKPHVLSRGQSRPVMS